MERLCKDCQACIWTGRMLCVRFAHGMRYATVCVRLLWLTLSRETSIKIVYTGVCACCRPTVPTALRVWPGMLRWWPVIWWPPVSWALGLSAVALRHAASGCWIKTRARPIASQLEGMDESRRVQWSRVVDTACVSKLYTRVFSGVNLTSFADVEFVL